MRIIVGVLLILLSIWLALKGPEYFFDLEPGVGERRSAPLEKKNNPSPSDLDTDLKKRVDWDQKADQHLKNTYYRIEFERSRREVELKKEFLRPGHNIFNQELGANGKEYPLFAEDEGWKRRIEPFREKKPTVVESPRDLVLEELASQQQNDRQEQEYRRYYIWQFRRNAWYGGYDVRVDQNGNVTYVRRLSESERKKPFPEEK
ncbi:MAG: hypothetical protein NZ480_02035 [Bdellovibrionaceae bacterium]|nr:hypothetical protein [Pseudobdellovibrionaceae bacterium]MDW8190532.1 hypothetical protein [Pseudobdellovibrionaceae bacterium]